MTEILDACGIVALAMIASVIIAFISYLSNWIKDNRRALASRKSTPLQMRNIMYGRIHILERNLGLDESEFIPWWDEEESSNPSRDSLYTEAKKLDDVCRTAYEKERQDVHALKARSNAVNLKAIARPQTREVNAVSGIDCGGGPKMYREMIVMKPPESRMTMGIMEPHSSQFITIQLPFEMTVEEAGRWREEYLRATELRLPHIFDVCIPGDRRPNPQYKPRGRELLDSVPITHRPIHMMDVAGHGRGAK